MDSHVLLHAFMEIRDKVAADITALHVDHGISSKSAYWAEHCRDVCAKLGIKLIVRRLDQQCPPGDSLESWARSARFGVFKEYINSGGVVCTAQHRDDQAETILLQLFRGGGPRGLSAMPEVRRIGRGWLARPLLEFSRDSLRDYASARDLSWIEDDMNADQNYDRNFLRHTVLPLLKSRWPNVSGVLTRAGGHQAEAAALLDDIGALDLEALSLSDPDALPLSGMQNLSLPRRRNLIRYWFRSRGLPVPDSRTLRQILSEVLEARDDAQPCISWHGVEIRRYRQVLYLVTLPDGKQESTPRPWDLAMPYHARLGKLMAVRGMGRGIKVDAIPDGQVLIRYRCGGESLRPAGREHHRPLKKLLQEEHVPPWLRNYIPLLYVHEDLVAVAGFWIADSYLAGPEDDSWQISWEGAEKVIL